jgi:hypothetical protein
MGSLTETVIAHTHAAEMEQTQAGCPSCDGSLSVRRQGFHPLDASLEVVAGRYQLDVQRAMAQGAAEMPYETAKPAHRILYASGSLS